MNRKNQNPLLLAYIIFLGISIMYLILSELFKLDFPMWSKITIATTISSFAFSISSFYKFMAKQDIVYLQYAREHLGLIKQLKTKEIQLSLSGDKKEKIHQINEDMMQQDNNLIREAEDDLEKHEKRHLVLDVIGYLVFFCILCYEPLFNFFYQIQEICTVLAFLMIMLLEYFETVEATKYEKIFEDIINSTKETINDTEKFVSNRIEKNHD